MTKQQFSRAAMICLSQWKEDSTTKERVNISDQLVDVIFMMFDKAGDNKLSHEEFLVVLNEWKSKGGRMNARYRKKEYFWECVKRNSGRK